MTQGLCKTRINCQCPLVEIDSRFKFVLFSIYIAQAEQYFRAFGTNGQGLPVSIDSGLRIPLVHKGFAQIGEGVCIVWVDGKGLLEEFDRCLGLSVHGTGDGQVGEGNVISIATLHKLSIDNFCLPKVASLHAFKSPLLFMPAFSLRRLAPLLLVPSETLLPHRTTAL